MELSEIVAFIHHALDLGAFKFSVHATKEAFAESVSALDIEDALRSAVVLEDYPDWWLGPCALLYGRTRHNRDLHVVCSYTKLPMVIITVYEPKLPKWMSPTQRGSAT